MKDNGSINVVPQNLPAGITPTPPEVIDVNVMDLQGFRVYFRIHTTTKFRRLMDHYAERRGHVRSGLWFGFGDAKINPRDTPQSLHIKDNDTIYVISHLNPESRNFPVSIPTPDTLIELDFMTVKGTKTTIKLNKYTKMNDLMNVYAQKVGQDRNSLRFIFNGVEVPPKEPPFELHMTNKDVVQVIVSAEITRDVGNSDNASVKS
ncbi:hypothetical protein CROQUDRAFT_658077 [Cronartium quercuum f. sp. fusiforme G11]|uniref:Ubiquitin-like domain-containing protein n=1 Tax=Cronartium quercuum f. sp. fusiforme G11 TaxID=708437 RepID=A0A9P6NL03_9BASI|nr:hypothetical protein CROQUDRAFT_658077 [Cronartium quercuum f. sp. fusiforme G11]